MNNATQTTAADSITVNLERVPLWDAPRINPIIASLERIIATCDAIDREIKAMKETLNN
jgi:hypothetical protein